MNSTFSKNYKLFLEECMPFEFLLLKQILNIKYFKQSFKIIGNIIKTD